MELSKCLSYFELSFTAMYSVTWKILVYLHDDNIKAYAVLQ